MKGDALGRWTGHLLAATALVFAVGVAAVAGTSPVLELSSSPNGPDATGGPLDQGERAGPSASLGDTGDSGAGGGSRGSGADVASGGATEGGDGSAPIYDVGVSDTEIRIGGSTFTSGPAAVYGEQIAVGFTAGVQYVNDTGGVNGRRLVLKLYDDGGDPAKQLANTKRLLEIDKVFALSMVYAPIAGEYVSQKRVPVMHLGQFNEEFLNPWWFPLGGPQRTASYQLAHYGAKELGVKSVAVFYLDVGAANYSRAYAESVKKDWEAYGVEVPVLAPFAADQTSCSDAVGQARDAGVDFIQFEIDAGKVINCGVEAQIQAYKPPKGWGGYLIGVPVIHEALGDFSIGMYAFDAFGALYDVKAYQDYVRRVSPKTESYSSVTISYFVAALLLRDAIEALGDNITRERLADVINTFTRWRPGLTSHPNQPSWTWRRDCHLALSGGYVIQVQKHADELRWTQITPQLTSTPLPPGVAAPREFAGCPNVFRRG